MSEYQRYEWMTTDRPLTRSQLDAVSALSSHIDASSIHALVEYQWGNFKHDPLQVLHKFFDGFLYWANWDAPELAFRFPHGILPVELLGGYELDDVVTFTQYPDYDLLDIHFGELEAPDEWIEYELGSLMALREELMDGDLRALYIVWLASQRLIGSAGADEEQENEGQRSRPSVPPALGTLTSAQQALSELLQVPPEVLVAAARQSSAAPAATHQDVAAWVMLLPSDRRTEYLVRLARNEPELSRLLVRELRQLSQDKSSVTPSRGEYVTYATLFAESKAIRAQWEREKREQVELARERQLQQIHDHPDQYWHHVDLAVTRSAGAGYDEAARILSELREVAERFYETRQFHERFRVWVQPHLRRPAFVKRLQDRRFPLPDA